jgi:ketol-acid reductoisomerase
MFPTPCASPPSARSVRAGRTLTENNFTVGTYQELIPSADVVLNLTPDKQHTNVVEAVMPLMKKGSTLGYSHGFNIVEEGMQIRKDITVVMMAPNPLVLRCVKSTNGALVFRL